jgi:CBS domain-containing protein
MSTVQQILANKNPGAVTMNADETVLNAVLMMDRAEVGALVVTDVAGIGIFTERDLLRRVVAKQCDPAHVGPKRAFSSAGPPWRGEESVTFR